MTSGLTEEVISPREIIIPTVTGGIDAQPTMSGALFMSGAKLYVRGATASELITSA